MAVDRRCALKLLAGAGAATAASSGQVLAAAERREPPDEAVGMLYDTTRCIGCKACVVACREANGLPPETGTWPEGIYDAPVDLSGGTKNIIRLYQEGDRQSYVKNQCMHCVDPACVAACMLGALRKDEQGVVYWTGDRCVGCRYCQMACPFNIPKFEWASLNPKIVKCEMCRHLLAKGGIPACVRVCPREAVIFGKRSDLLTEAKGRIAASPGKYVPKVYGELDGGGTQVLYLSHVPFDRLGFPELGQDPVPNASRAIQHTVYKGFLAPAALYAVLGFVLLRNRRAAPGDGHGEEPK